VIGRLAAALATVAGLAGCAGGDEERVSLYLPQRLGPDGPPGQIARVLMPVDREPRPATAPARQAVLDLRVGPSPEERAHGFTAALDPKTRIRDVRVASGVATVELAGREPDIGGTGSIVYSLTELPGVHVVRIRLDGRPCCAYTHAGHAIVRQTRRLYYGWSGEPCAFRTRRDALRCRGS
jgi:hypothetical protein